MGIRQVADELYGIAPEEFTAARNARVTEAKSTGEAELAEVLRGLRKPTVGAWLLNQLVRRHRDEVGRLFELGARLRAAQGTLGAAELRALGEQRRQLTRAVAEQAAGIGREDGRKISAQVVAGVEETLRSAMVDAQAGAALATGLLVDTFSSTGLEQVDLAAVLAVPSAVDGASPLSSPHGTPGSTRAERPLARKQRNDAAIASARQALEQSEADLEQAREEGDAARQSAVEAGRRKEDLESELAQARRRVKDLQKQLDTAEEAADEARRIQIATTRAERSATEAADRAQRRLKALLDDG